MKITIPKTLSLTISAIVLFAFLGVSTALAADLPFDIGAGNIDITDSSNSNGLTITQGSNQSEILKNEMIIISGSSTANTITVGNNISPNIKLNGANITAPSGKAVISAGTGSTANLLTDAASTLIGGINGSINMAGGTLAVSGNISGNLTITGGSITLQNGTVTGTATLQSGTLIIGTGAAQPADFKVDGGTYLKGSTTLYKTIIGGLPAGKAAVFKGNSFTVGLDGTITDYLPQQADTSLSITADGKTYENTVSIEPNHTNQVTVYVCSCIVKEIQKVTTADKIIIPAGSSSATLQLTPQCAYTVCEISGHKGKTPTFTYESIPAGRVNSQGLITAQLSDTSVQVVITAHLNDKNTSLTLVFPVVKNNTVAFTLAQDSIRHGRDIVIQHNGGAGFRDALNAGKLINNGVEIAKNYYQVSDTTITIKGTYSEISAGKTLNINAVTDAYVVAAPLQLPVLNNIGTVQQPAQITGSKVGTSFSSLPLPKTIKVVLDGDVNMVAELPVQWNQNSYNSNTTSLQTITGTLQNIPGHITLNPNTANVTVPVTLYRSSGGGGGNDNQPNYEYDFWLGIKDRVINADSGDTVRVYAKSYDNLPAVILEKLKGRSITLIIERDKGKDITIYGKNIKKIESGRIYYTLSDLEKLYKDGGKKPDSSSSAASSSSSSSSSATSKPTVISPVIPSPPPVVSSQSSSESSSETSEQVDSSSSEEELEEDTELVDAEPEQEESTEPEKKKMSPLVVVVLITVIVAAVSGIVACIVLQKKKFN